MEGCQMGSLEAHFFFLFMGLALGFFSSMTCSGAVFILYSIFVLFFFLFLRRCPALAYVRRISGLKSADLLVCGTTIK